jgi:hypothetical protein
MPASDYTLEVIAAGISFGADFTQAAKNGLALGRTNTLFPAGTGKARAHEGSQDCAA